MCDVNIFSHSLLSDDVARGRIAPGVCVRLSVVAEEVDAWDQGSCKSPDSQTSGPAHVLFSVCVSPWLAVVRYEMCRFQQAYTVSTAMSRWMKCGDRQALYPVLLLQLLSA